MTAEQAGFDVMRTGDPTVHQPVGTTTVAGATLGEKLRLPSPRATDDDACRVLIVEDHPAFLEGLSAILNAEAAIEVVGTATTGGDAVRLAADLRPDVILMDLQLPDLNGIDATRAIVAVDSGVAVLVVTMFDEDESVLSALRAGARGYLLKGATRGEIVRSVRAVAAGEAIFGPQMARRMTTYFSARPGPAVENLPELTAREREVLDLIAAGRNNTQITQHLVLSPKTVRNHISNIFAKLQVSDRGQAIVRARNAGLGQEL